VPAGEHFAVAVLGLHARHGRVDDLPHPSHTRARLLPAAPPGTGSPASPLGTSPAGGWKWAAIQLAFHTRRDSPQSRQDCCRAAEDIVLTTPGLPVIIDAIKASRKIFQRMNSYAIYRVAETLLGVPQLVGTRSG
jgi:hypothetical protein